MNGFFNKFNLNFYATALPTKSAASLNKIALCTFKPLSSINFLATPANELLLEY